MKKSFKYGLLGLTILVVGCFCGVQIYKHRLVAMGVHCSSSLEQIDSAKTIVAQRLKLAPGDQVDSTQIAELCKDGVLPKCPAGGIYSINPVGTSPTCFFSSNHPYHRCE